MTRGKIENRHEANEKTFNLTKSDPKANKVNIIKPNRHRSATKVFNRRGTTQTISGAVAEWINRKRAATVSTLHPISSPSPPPSFAVFLFHQLSVKRFFLHAFLIWYFFFNWRLWPSKCVLFACPPLTDLSTHTIESFESKRTNKNRKSHKLVFPQQCIQMYALGRTTALGCWGETAGI